MIGLPDRWCNRGQILPGRLRFRESRFTAASIAAGLGLGEENVGTGAFGLCAGLGDGAWA
jgi:hypothetical protein